MAPESDPKPERGEEGFWRLSEISDCERVQAEKWRGIQRGGMLRVLENEGDKVSREGNDRRMEIYNRRRAARTGLWLFAAADMRFLARAVHVARINRTKKEMVFQQSSCPGISRISISIRGYMLSRIPFKRKKKKKKSRDFRMLALQQVTTTTRCQYKQMLGALL